MKARTVTEYRLRWKRADREPMEKRFRSIKALRDRIGLLTSDEPWRFFGDDGDRARDGDDLVCCAGTVYDQCACGGLTLREQAAERRKGLQPIEWVRVHARQVTTTSWEPYCVSPDCQFSGPHAITECCPGGPSVKVAP